MSGRSWRAIVAVGGCLTAFTLSLNAVLAVPPPNGLSGQRGERSETVQAQPADDQRASTSNTLGRSEREQQSATEDAERCDDQGDNNGPDICAQWVAANAAREAATISRDTLDWTIAAFFALVLTLAATAWSAWASTVAAFAAAKSANLTEESAALSAINAKRQIRAYLVVSGVRIKYNAVPPDISPGFSTSDPHPLVLDIEIVVENVGSTPASQVRVHMRNNFVSMRDAFAPLVTQSSHFFMESLGRMREISDVFTVPSCIWGRDVISEVEVEIIGTLQWKDVFGEAQEGKFTFSYDPRPIGFWPPVYEEVPFLEWVATKEKATREPRGPGR